MSKEARPSGTFIGDNHRRGISVTLTLLDEILCRFERWTKGRTAEGPLYSERNDLSDDRKEVILAEIAAIRAVVVRLRDELALEPKTERISTLIWSQCAWFWESLVELESKHLRRYGELAPGFAAFFDPQVAELIERMDEISRIARQV
ncbi:hypothetical protein JW916_05330 [Candidatus Sumerlaeota bacterium]|nr:hypothetical protein [Candidatus Sumerlaeota bacterium]